MAEQRPAHVRQHPWVWPALTFLAAFAGMLVAAVFDRGTWVEDLLIKSMERAGDKMAVIEAKVIRHDGRLDSLEERLNRRLSARRVPLAEPEE